MKEDRLPTLETSTPILYQGIKTCLNDLQGFTFWLYPWRSFMSWMPRLENFWQQLISHHFSRVFFDKRKYKQPFRCFLLSSAFNSIEEVVLLSSGKYSSTKQINLLQIAGGKFAEV